MKIEFFGGAGEVGRSCVMIESNDTRILLDCGVKLGRKEEYPIIDDERLKGIDGIVVSHAHLDHCGYLPHVFSTGWRGFVYTTKPTFELTNVLISDYLKISNPQNVTKDGVAAMGRHFKIQEYHKEFKIKGLTIKLLPAGHILGSAMIEVSDGVHRIIYTGDLNLRKTRLLDGAYTEYLNADTLITESTYGGDNDVHQAERITADQILNSIKDTIKQGGKVIIPSFAVGRAQEVLFILDDYMKSGLLQNVHLYIDGMIGKAMRIHRHNVIDCRDELQKRILMSEDDPFKSKNFIFIKTKQDRARAMSTEEASVIVTTSGMLTGGPVVRYLKRLGKDPKNKLILVGYQAEGTNGRALLEGERELVFDNNKIQINMTIENYSLSAHADRQQLMKFVGKINGLRNVFVIHGDPKKSEQFAAALKKKYNVHVPMLGESFDI